MSDEKTTGQTTGTAQPSFGLEKIYLKDVSYEAPGAPAVFLQAQAPEIGVQIGLTARPIEDQQDFYEVILTIQITAKRDDKVLFLVEVQQAGVFRIQGIGGEALQHTLEVTCAYVLLPFAREAVNDLVSKGGFPQLLINPINFDALFEQKRANAKQAAQGNA
jgi:preprotein translocase subunit SecB